MLSTAWRSAEDDPNPPPRGRPTLLPVRCRRGPDPESVLVLLVGIGIFELLGCLALIPGVPETELFLELGRELLILDGVDAWLIAD